MSEIKKGTAVVVIKSGYTYTTYRDMAKVLGAKQWASGVLPQDGGTYLVKKVHHRGSKFSQTYLLIEDEAGAQFIIDSKGVSDPDADPDFHVVLVPVTEARVKPAVTLVSPSSEEVEVNILKLVKGHSEDYVAIVYHDGRTCNVYGHTSREVVKTHAESIHQQASQWIKLKPSEKKSRERCNY